MKIYLPGVTRFNFYDDGFVNANIDVVAEREKIGFDAKGLWVEAGEPEEIAKLRKRILELKGYKTDHATEFDLRYF